jgi:hypothetical protein
MPQNQGMVEDIGRQLDNAVARIHEDLDLTNEAKNRMIKEVYQEARSKIVQDAEEAREDLEADLRVARRTALAPPALQGSRIDEAQVAKWYFEEIQERKEISEPLKLEEVLNEAILYNNVVRAKAVLCRAYAMGNSRLVGRYLESFPEEEAAWDDLQNAAEAYNEWERGAQFFGTSGRLAPLEHYLA